MTMGADKPAEWASERDNHTTCDIVHAQFEDLYEQYYGRIFNYVMRSVMSNSLAEDIVSETFLKALRGFPRYRGGPERLLGWLYRIATNTLLDHYRRSKKEKSQLFLEATGEILVGQGLVAADDPRMAHERVECYQELHRAIQRLKDIYRVTIVLHYFEERSVKEIAETLRCTRVTVKWRLHHARKQLAVILEKENAHHED